MSLSLQDMLVIVATIVGPLGALMGFMWVHFNNRFEKMDLEIENLRTEVHGVEKRLEDKINGVEKRLSEKLGEKIDAVRDRVSRIEGQLVPAKVITLEGPRHQGATRSSHGKAAQAQ